MMREISVNIAYLQVEGGEFWNCNCRIAFKILSCLL